MNEVQDKRADVFVKCVLSVYLVLAFWATSNVWSFSGMVLAGAAVYAAGFTEAVRVQRRTRPES